MKNTSLLLLCSDTTHQLDQARAFLHQPVDHADFHIINKKDEDGNFSAVQIEDVREMSSHMTLRPYQAEQSVYLLLEIDRASLPAQNALLKSLEEPPAHVQIVLTTNDAQRIIPTILSRCDKISLIDQSKNEVNENFATLLATIENGTYSDVFLLSEQYKDRTAAQKLMKDLVRFLNQENEVAPHAGHLQKIQKCIDTLGLLEKNVNVRLALEECFFSFQDSRSN